MKLVRHRIGKNSSKPKVVGEQRYASLLLGGGISHYEKIEARLDFDFSDLKDEHAHFSVEMTPEEAIRLGQKLLDEGTKLKAQLERCQAAGKIVD